MNFQYIAIAVGCSMMLLIGTITRTYADDKVIESWKNLEVELDQLLLNADKTNLSAILKSSFCARVYQSKDVTIMQAMVTSRTDLPGVCIAGFMMLLDVDKAGAFEAALRVLSTTTKPASFVYADLIKHISTYKWEERQHSAFSDIALHPAVDMLNSSVLVGVVPIETLEAWFTSNARKTADIERVMLVVDRLLDEKDRIKKSTVLELKGMLASARSIPGFCRYIYVIHSDSNDEGFIDSMCMVLGDENLSDGRVVLAVSRHRTFLSANVNELRGRVSETRMKTVQKMLEDNNK